MTKVLLGALLKGFISKFGKATCVFLCISAMSASHIAVAQDDEVDWVFDVEVFAFKRALPDDHPESFDLETFYLTNQNALSIYTLHLLQRLNPNINLANSLPLCNEEEAAQMDDGEAAQLDEDEAIQTNEDQVLIEDQLITNDENTSDVLDDKEVIGHIRRFKQTGLNSDITWFVDQQTWLKDEAYHAESVTCIDSREYPDETELPSYIFDVNDENVVGTNEVPVFQLLATEELYLKGFIEKLSKQSGVEPLMYKAWRQPVVFGEDNAMYYKILGGSKLDLNETESLNENYDLVLERPENAEMNSLDNSPLDSTPIESDYPNDTIDDINIESQVASIKDALDTERTIVWDEPTVTNTEEELKALTIALLDENEESIDLPEVKAPNWPTWELEGLFKVYLESVNRVPYLHIDSELVHAQMKYDSEGLPYIQSYPAKQRRRIISRQIHYFDHPAFGVIVRLQRYKKPDPTELEALE